MAVLISVALLVICMAIAVAAIKAGQSVFVFIWCIGAMLLSSSFGSWYGIYSWLRYGSWASFTARDGLNYLASRDEQFKILLTPSSWVGVQTLNEYYLASNVVWTLFLIPLITMLISISVLEDMKKEKKLLNMAW